MTEVKISPDAKESPSEDMGGYPHYMLKEINEQAESLKNTLAGRISGGRVNLSPELTWSEEDVRQWKKLHIVACGTSYYSGLVAERFFESITGFETRVEVASEYACRNLPAGPDTLAVFVTQSGETADTIEAERAAREKGARLLAITNAAGSTIAREVHDTLLLNAGPEIGVAATKSFTGQLTVLYLLALQLARLQGKLREERERFFVDELEALPFKVQSALSRQEDVLKAVLPYGRARDFLFLGRGPSYPVALEGALKLKEISYVHSEAFAGGELKHGPIALLDSSVPVVVIAPRDGHFEKNRSSIRDIKAGNSPVIVVTTEGDHSLEGTADHILTVPEASEMFTPFLTVLPLQLFSYYFARNLGRNIDRPRNLTKSVTE
ncbi:MAG: glutamine--fructose-6-phosphate transaminase (isomerizing) [Aminivibrio sp.]